MMITVTITPTQMPTKIPPRQPIGESCGGHLYTIDGVTLFATQPITELEPTNSGDFVLRYGIRYLGKPHLSIVPGMVAVDYGEIITGVDAWHFLFHRSNLYPRADVIGYRNDGEDEMLPVKQLDMMQPVEVLIYPDETATKPIAKPVACISAKPDDLPEFAQQYMTHYTTLADWRSKNP